MSNDVTPKQYLRIEEFKERILQLRKENHNKLGEACAPELQGRLDCEPGQSTLDFQWVHQVAPLNDELNRILLDIVAQRPHPHHDEFTPIPPEKLWLWGGPTSEWGGSTASDCLIREKSFFNTDNAVYVYGETTDQMLEINRGFKKLLCQVNSNCRAPGKLAGSEEENAELLSKLSLKHPNIVGAMCDDYATGFYNMLLPERFEKIYRGVKKYNDQLQVYGVIYAHQLNQINFELVQPYIDVVNFWLWNKNEIIDVDRYIEILREKFPGKKVLLGLFIHDYGVSDVDTPNGLLLYQLERAGVLFKKQWIDGLVVLGDREIRKWPKNAAAVAQFLKTDQYHI